MLVRVSLMSRISCLSETRLWYPRRILIPVPRPTAQRHIFVTPRHRCLLITLLLSPIPSCSPPIPLLLAADSEIHRCGSIIIAPLTNSAPPRCPADMWHPLPCVAVAGRPAFTPTVVHGTATTMAVSPPIPFAVIAGGLDRNGCGRCCPASPSYLLSLEHGWRVRRGKGETLLLPQRHGLMPPSPAIGPLVRQIVFLGKRAPSSVFICYNLISATTLVFMPLMIVRRTQKVGKIAPMSDEIKITYWYMICMQLNTWPTLISFMFIAKSVT